jgi:hypothetical protein
MNTESSTEMNTQVSTIVTISDQGHEASLTRGESVLLIGAFIALAASMFSFTTL